MARGRFITFEGIDGAGKSTHIATVRTLLQERGRDVLLTREPGGTPAGEALREVVLRADMSMRTETLVMFAARAEHVERLIAPALQAGRWVLCDRFTDATYAYQGGGRGVADPDIDALVRIVHPRRQPDLTLLLDAPVELGMRRAQARNGAAGPDRFETERSEFFERVRQRYLERAAREPGRFRVIDAGDTPETVEAKVRDALAALRAPVAGAS